MYIKDIILQHTTALYSCAVYDSKKFIYVWHKVCFLTEQNKFLFGHKLLPSHLLWLPQVWGKMFILPTSWNVLENFILNKFTPQGLLHQSFMGCPRFTRKTFPFDS